MHVVTINPFTQHKMVEAIGLIYQQSFGGEPWNEGYCCPICKTVFARIPHVTICSVCAQQSRNVLVIEFWPMSKIISDFYREMQKPDAICIVAQSNERVIGFAWGYRVSANTDIDEYLEAPGVHALLQGDFFYLDECALVPAYQGKGIGTLLVNSIIHKQNYTQILLRTMNHSRMYHLINRLGGKILQEISRGRIIMKLTVS